MALMQLGQHELVREIHRIQVWIQSLNGGWSSNTPPDDWKNPIPILENRCKELQAQYGNFRPEASFAPKKNQIVFLNQVYGKTCVYSAFGSKHQKKTLKTCYFKVYVCFNGVSMPNLPQNGKNAQFVHVHAFCLRINNC